MPKGQPLSDAQKRAIYNAYTEGESYEDIAATYGIAASTVRKTINGQREKRGMAAKSKIVAGDKTNGRLTSTTDPHRYEGTCVIGGKSKSKLFMADNAHRATEMWEKWCQGLRDEQAFMDMVERKDEPQPQDDESVDVTPAPVPEIVVRPWKDVAEERKQRIEELERELDEAKTQRVELAEGYQMELHNPAYLIWAKSPEPRCYGLYLTVESALAEVDRLNDVAKFLGSSGAFEVEEVAWKG